MRIGDKDIEDLLIDLLATAKTQDTYNKGQGIARNLTIYMNNNPHLFVQQGTLSTLLGLCQTYLNTVYNMIAQVRPEFESEERDQKVITMAQEMLRSHIKRLEDFRDKAPRNEIRRQYIEREKHHG
jgi:hypothetical protein